MEPFFPELVIALVVTALLALGLFGGCFLGLTRLWPSASPVDLMLATPTLGMSLLCVSLPVLSYFSAIHRTGLAVISGMTLFVGGALWLTGPRPGETSRADVLLPPPLVATLLLGMGLWGATYYLLRGLLLPVETVSDAPIYHLYFAARWWQAGSLPLIPTPFGEEAASYFPANGELWLTWLWTAMDSDTLAKVGQWPFLWMGSLALFAIARRFTSPPAALVPAVLWASTFLSLYSSSLANVDLIFCSSYLTAVYFLLRSEAHQRTRNSHPQPPTTGTPYRSSNEFMPLLLAGLAAGIAIGTKSIGLVYVALLVPLFIWRIVRSKRIISNGVMVTVAILLPSAFWYARNTWLTGNPLYPLSIRWLGIELLPGWYDRSAMLQSGYHVDVTNGRYLLSRLSTVLDLRLAVLWPVAILAAVVSIRRTRFPAGLCLLGGILAAAYWFVIPYNTQERFLLPALALSLAPLAIVVERCKWLSWLALLLLAWHLLTPAWYLDEALMLKTDGVLTLPLHRSPLAQGSLWHAALLPASIAIGAFLMRRRFRGRVLLAGLMIVAGGAVSTWPLIRILRQQPILAHYPASDFGKRLFPAWQLLEEASTSDGQTVAYAGTNLPYYLLGSHLRHRVQYVNVAGEGEWLPHDFAFEREEQGLSSQAAIPWPGWPRATPDYDAWVRNLREQQVEFLFVARENQHARPDAAFVPPFPIEHYWAESHPETFQRIGPAASPNGTQPWAIVYRVHPPDH